MKPSEFITKNEKKVSWIVFDNRVYLSQLDVKCEMNLIKKKLDKRFIDKEELKKKINLYFFELLKLNSDIVYVNNYSIIILKDQILKLLEG